MILLIPFPPNISCPFYLPSKSLLLYASTRGQQGPVPGSWYLPGNKGMKGQYLFRAKMSLRFTLGSFLWQMDFLQNILQINQRVNCVGAQQHYRTERSLRVSFTVQSLHRAGAGNSSIHPLKLLFNNKRVLYLELFPWSSSIQGPLSQEAFKG